MGGVGRRFLQLRGEGQWRKPDIRSGYTNRHSLGGVFGYLVANERVQTGSGEERKWNVTWTESEKGRGVKGRATNRQLGLVTR